MIRTTDKKTLEELLAKDSIREALFFYCRGEDRLDGAATQSAFHKGATINYGHGGDNADRPISEFVQSAHSELARSSGSSHQIANILIRVDGELAVSEASVTARIWSVAADGKILQQVYVGRYLDRWSCQENRWAIDHRDFICDVSYALRTDNRPGGLPIRGCHGPTDPSYELFRQA